MVLWRYFADLPPHSLRPTSWLLRSLEITGSSTHALMGWGGIFAHCRWHRFLGWESWTVWKGESEKSTGVQGSISPDCGCCVTNCFKLLLPGHHYVLDAWTVRQRKHFLELLLSGFCITTADRTTKTAPFLASWSQPTLKKKILTQMCNPTAQ